MTLDAVAAAVRQLSPRLTSELAVAALYVFGSVARGDARPDSDVDVLVEFDGTATFARFMDLKALLEDALDARVDDRITLAYADTLVTEAEDSIDPVVASFGSVGPPEPSLDELRSDVLDQLAHAGDLLADARIAVRRGDDEAMATLSDDLRAVADAMEHRAEALR